MPESEANQTSHTTTTLRPQQAIITGTQWTPEPIQTLNPSL
jgi:hypothetical protein